MPDNENINEIPVHEPAQEENVQTEEPVNSACDRGCQSQQSYQTPTKDKTSLQYDKMYSDLKKAASALITTMVIILCLAFGIALYSVKTIKTQENTTSERLETIEETLGIEQTDEDDRLDSVVDEYADRLETLYQQNIDVLNQIRDQYAASNGNTTSADQAIPDNDDIYNTETEEYYDHEENYQPAVSSDKTETSVLKKVGGYSLVLNGDALTFDYGNGVTAEPFTVTDDTVCSLTMITPSGKGPETFRTYSENINDIINHVNAGENDDYVVLHFDGNTHVLYSITYFHYETQDS